MKYIKKLRLITESKELEDSFLSLIEEYPVCSYDYNVLRIKTPHIPIMKSIDEIDLYSKSIEEFNLLIKELIICLNRTNQKFISNYNQYINVLELRFITNEEIIIDQEDRLLLHINDLETKLLSINPNLEDLAITTSNNLLFISVNSDSCDEDTFVDLIKSELTKILNNIGFKSEWNLQSFEDVDDHSNFFVSITITFNKKIIEV